jgi:O-antigen ligase
MMLLSGARGPWLGVFLATGLYLLLEHRKLLLTLIILAIVTYLPAKHFYPTQLQYLESRILSIADTEGEHSVRLNLWKLSMAQNRDKLTKNPITLLFGSGPKNHIHEYRAYFEATPHLTPEEKNFLSSHGYPTGEVHNMYLDSTAKMGVLWTASVFWLLLALGIKGFKPHGSKRTSTMGASLATLCFLVTGIFYDILPHFATFWLIFFVALSLNMDSSPKRPISATGLRGNAK